MKNSYKFRQAEERDLQKMADIEEEYFGGYSRAYDFLFMQKWYLYNRDMFYVVSEEAGTILAFLILTPITENLHKQLLQGKVSDMFDFPLDDVLEQFESEFYYVADICVSKRNEGVRYLTVAVALIRGLIELLNKNAKYVTTSPITKDGVRLCEKIGFEVVSEEIYEDKSYPICLLECNEEARKKFERILRRL